MDLNYHTVSPVLFLVFNRPIESTIVFEAIREVKPPRLYFAADGPRSNRMGESLLCEETRSLLKRVDWACETKTLFRSENLGCGKAVSQALDWFFEYESEGIILEDDCVPNASFFRFMDQMLAKYRFDQRIGTISGNGYVPSGLRGSSSYIFSKIAHIWGWATWKRVWSLYDFGMSCWPTIRDEGWLWDLLQDKRAVRAWTESFDLVFSGKVDTWDAQLALTLWTQGMVSVLPRENTVRNVGFGENATHTRADNSTNPARESVELGFPLSHPLTYIIDSHFEDLAQREFHRPGLGRKILFKVISIAVKLLRGFK